MNLPNSVKNLIKRAIISIIADDTKDIRVQQISANGKAIEGEVYFPYGMSANVPVGSLCVYLQVGGDEGNLIILPDRSQDRVKNLEPGEVAFFNPLTQTRTIYRKNGTMEIITSGEVGDLDITVKGNVNISVTGDANITAPTINLNGNVNIDGALDVTGDIEGNEVTAGSTDLSSHRHGGSATAPTGPIVPTGTPI